MRTIIAVTALGLGAGCGLLKDQNAACVDGFTSCPPTGFDAGNPLENQYTPECVDLQTSTLNCGACGITCPSNLVCVNGLCGCAPSGTECEMGLQPPQCCAGLHCAQIEPGSPIGACK
jgi:hypothetical protein